MARLRAFGVPAAFFVGLALICASLIEFVRWIYVWAHLSSDADIESPRFKWVLEVQGLVPEPLLSDRSMWLALGAAGLLLVILKRQQAGAWLLGLSTLLGVLPSVLLGLEYSFVPAVDLGCHSQGLSLPPFLVQVLTFVLVVAVLIGVAWLIAQRHDGVPITPESLIGLGVALLMLGITVLYAESSASQLTMEALAKIYPRRPPDVPGRPTLVIVALAGVGLWLSRRPLYVSRFVSLTVLLLGLSMALPALAIVHDEQVQRRVAHEGASSDEAAWSDTLPYIESIQTTRCEAVELAPIIQLAGAEAFLSGEPTDATSDALESRVFENVTGQIERDRDLRSQAGDEDEYRLKWQLRAASDTPLRTSHRVLRALKRAGVERVFLTHARGENLDLWVQPMVHRHVCALTIELSDTGKPIGDFADWPSLVRAADQTAGTFQLDAR